MVKKITLKNIALHWVSILALLMKLKKILEKRVNFFSISLFSRNKSEIKMTRDRHREEKFQKKFSRIETLTGH